MDGQKTKQPSKLSSWAHKHKGPLLFVVAILVMLGAGGAVLAALYKPAPKVADVKLLPIKKPAPKPVVYVSPLTGVPVADEATAKLPVTGIMIENSDSARPQSGLKDAGIVYEAIAEGGITRFLALYQEAKPTLIGPVRSVRQYFVEWADPYNASIAHVGGSANALSMIRSGSYSHDLDQFFNGNSYWRATDRYSPHNVYTSFDKLASLESSKGITSSTFTGFPRKKDTPAQAPTATNISVSVSGPDYDSSYVYDAASNSYLRSEGGAPHLDREKGQIAPKVVVVMDVNMTLVLQDGYREQIPTTGSGKAYVFQDGTVTEATWSRGDVKSQLSFTDSAGKLIALNAGQTWITATPNGPGVTWQ